MTYTFRHVTKRIGQSIAYRLFRLAVHLTFGLWRNNANHELP
jgi:hypothetical protein